MSVDAYSGSVDNTIPSYSHFNLGMVHTLAKQADEAIAVRYTLHKVWIHIMLCKLHFLSGIQRLQKSIEPEKG